VFRVGEQKQERKIAERARTNAEGGERGKDGEKVRSVGALRWVFQLVNEASKQTAMGIKN
jgi:hypothetical protein